MTEASGIPLFSLSNKSSQYRLIQLTPEVQDILKSEDERRHLKIKSAGPNSPVYLCSFSKTFQIKEVNQSNTLLLLSSEGAGDIRKSGEYGELRILTAQKLSGGYLECLPVQSTCDLSFVPLYHGSEVGIPMENNVDIEGFQTNIPLSTNEYEKAWVDWLCVQLGRQVFRLSSSVVRQVLLNIVTAIQIEGLNFRSLELKRVYEAVHQDQEEPTSVLETVLRKFSVHDSEPYCLDEDRICQWFGQKALIEHASKEIKLASFMEIWHSSLPVSLDFRCELSQLVGQFVQITPDTIQHLSRERLPKDPRTRFEILFKTKSMWLEEEIIPFIDDIEGNRAKINNLFLKFAKRKVVKGVVYISRRST
ncbi:sister chromatid cohesion protein Dcc1 [Dipodascopsis uninucleata]